MGKVRRIGFHCFQHYPRGKQMDDYNKGRVLPKWSKNKKFNTKFSPQLKIKLTKQMF